MKNFTVRDICFIGIFTAIIAVMAQISIPMPNGVPMTLQTFAIPFAGIILGPRKGTVSVLIYILLGMLGAPVFTRFAGGPGIILGPTGGFILSFPFMAFAAGVGAKKISKVWLSAGLVTGAVINFLCGMCMYSFVTSSNLHTAFIACVLPFIPTAIIKIVLAGILGLNIKNALKKGRILL